MEDARRRGRTMRILYFGTPDFAVTVLKHVMESEFGKSVTAVVTRIDMPKNRGHNLTPPPVKEYAESMGLEVYQPEKLKTEEFKNWFNDQNPDLVLVAAYGKILPDYVVNGPKLGAINVHGSLLPYYRGAAPIERAIMNGEKELGITIMKMDEGLDTGDMLAKASIKSDDLTGGQAEQQLAELGGKLLVEVLRNPEKYVAQKQDLSINSYAAKITEEDRKLSFKSSPVDIHNKIRALMPATPCTVNLNGQSIKITSSRVSSEPSSGEPGTIHSLNAKGSGFIKVNCIDGTIDILSLTPPGKNNMSSGDFIRGRKINETDIFS